MFTWFRSKSSVPAPVTPTPSTDNLGEGSATRAGFTNAERTWSEDVNVLECPLSVLRDQGIEAKAFDYWIEMENAAELFTYALQSFGKAKTVGQGTNGIAHLVGSLPIDQHFIGRFSTYRNINPVTKSDWEGVGVAPDTQAAPEDSLSIAIRLATASIERR
ncbi:S41 family peptidase [Pseudomarimonas arenosa]|uniref:Uncharacterized protein n=1 Tax=Pseudomarimonas arenosa TaxID=2774145 RepID=A0AAW3ZUR8_9GAMM|nr:S41 family peptidase [Pseudomarimonas arenosa]MBD8528052.1 hypothetical protein [Pseudomarimonas arenosa]